MERFILTDLGTHVLDLARVLFGEANSLYCQNQRTLTPSVKGENVSTLLLSMGEAMRPNEAHPVSLVPQLVGLGQERDLKPGAKPPPLHSWAGYSQHSAKESDLPRSGT
ncbi:MAG: hypothetical protein ABMA26_10740 [Limisphaerales bacterium]